MDTYLAGYETLIDDRDQRASVGGCGKMKSRALPLTRWGRPAPDPGF